MRNTNSILYKSIQEYFRAIAVAHGMVNQFKMGEEWDKTVDENKYPLLYLDITEQDMVKTSSNRGFVELNYNITLYCFDKVMKDGGNMQQVYNDTLYVLNTIIDYIETSQYSKELSIKIEDRVPSVKCAHKEVDDLNGWMTRFILRVPSNFNLCNSPIDPFDFSVPNSIGIDRFRLIGPQGFQGSGGDGAQGFQGNQGAEGTNAANTFSWIVGKRGVPPGSGRFNTGDINWADLVGDDLYFNREAYNGLLSPISASFVDVQKWAVLLESYFYTGSTILFQIRSRTNPSNFGLYELGFIKYEYTYTNTWTIRFNALISATGSGLTETDICQFAYDTIGLNGAQGAEGPQGFQGLIGVQGAQGFQGNSGTYIKKDNITLTQSTWTFSTPYWNYTITDSDITSSGDFIIYTPYMTNISTVIDAIIYPYILVATGSATLYSENQPSGNIIGEMVILK